MVFGKKDHLVGLDIGSSFIKVAEIKVTGKGHVLNKFGMSKIAPGSIVEGRVVDVEGLAREIKALFKSQKIREKNVAISTGGHSVVIKTINTANKPEKELNETIYSEAEQYIPYDIDDVNIDYQILGQSEFSPDQVNILLVAVKKDLVAEYIDLIHQAGLNPRIIDVDTFALQNAYEILPYEKREQTTLLVDVGASKTSLNILKSNVSLMMRDNVSGTNQIVEEICNQYDISVKEAYQAANGESSTIGHEKIQEIGLRVAQSWCSEICEVVNTYQSGTSDEKVENIILSGGGVFVEGFQDSLLSELDADVSIINPFEALIVNEQKFSDSFITKASPLAPIAIGLALRRVDDK
ncbi:type IV pilus assembly protein PilM [Desulfobacterales bacterium HSG17]|nr:type IV pilus assembly protein PilM [Desulfobacterales bacterium HSG17]